MVYMSSSPSRSDSSDVVFPFLSIMGLSYFS